ncbi:hypothetical protein [Campylobacter sp. RM16188]|uniref:hypothetical protein n=1 Tax=Campylobacter sp. RM16188 TaxID=1705725 RepID=UPI001557D82F|nr:hypothetical protein [Campylobacter sp. RM16188]
MENLNLSTSISDFIYYVWIWLLVSVGLFSFFGFCLTNPFVKLEEKEIKIAIWGGFSGAVSSLLALLVILGTPVFAFLKTLDIEIVWSFIAFAFKVILNN